MKTSGKFYEIDGILYPRVTSILGIIAKPALVNWASNQQRQADMAAALELYKERWGCNAEQDGLHDKTDAAFVVTLEQRIGKEKAHFKTMNEAMTIGTEAHARCEWFLQKMMGVILPEPVVSEKALWASMAAEDWIKQNKFQPVFVEQTVYSSKNMYAGTADFWGLIGDDLILGDFKTGKAIYDEAYQQLSAYVMAFSEMGHGEAKRAIVLRLPKVVTDPAFEAIVIERDEIDKHFDAFLAAKKLWTWQQDMASRKKK